MYAWTSHIVPTLLILTHIVNVKSNLAPQHFGVVASDRKLSVTLFIVTVVTILTILPYAVYAVIMAGGKWNQLSKMAEFYILGAVYIISYASSLINPLIYTIRMKEFRKAAEDLICKRTVRSEVAFNQLKVPQCKARSINKTPRILQNDYFPVYSVLRTRDPVGI